MFEQELLYAVSQGAETEAAKLLAQGAKIEAVDELGRSPLMLAVQGHSLALTELCLRYQADPNQRDQTELTPFIAAAASGYSDLLPALIAAGADLPSVNRFGGTALLPSSEKGYLRTVQICLAAGVPVNHHNRLGWSALLEAVILGDGGYLYQEIIRALVASGADVESVDLEQQHALDYAISQKQTTVEAILRGQEQLTAHQRELRQLLAAGEWSEFQTKLAAVKEELSPTEAAFLAGYAWQEQRDYRQAELAYRAGLAESAEFYFYLANLYRLENNVIAALEMYQAGALAGPKAFFLYHQTNYLRELGRHQDALAGMAILLEADPQRPDYYFHQANSYRSLGNHQAAADAMTKAIELSPTNPLFHEHQEQSLASLATEKN